MQPGALRATLFLLGSALAPLQAQHRDGLIVGDVADSIHRRPLAGAMVVATPSDTPADTVFHAAQTDARGAFRILGLPPGRYRLTVEHPWIDSTGIGVPSTLVDVPVRSGATPAITLALPSVATLRRVLCPDIAADTTLGVMLGVVRDAHDAPLRDASVVFAWHELVVDRASAAVRQELMTKRAPTDSLGVYRACGLPVAHALFVQAQHDSIARTALLEAQLGEAGMLVRDFRLDTTMASTVDDWSVAGGASVSGRVIDPAGAGIRGASIRLFGTPLAATSGADGEFRLAGIPGGSQRIEIAALGFALVRIRVEVTPSSDRLVVTMHRAATVLDSIRVTARRSEDNGYAEFEARRRRGVGRFVTEADIEERKPFVTSDLLRMMNGFGAVVAVDGSVRVLANRGVYTLRGGQAPPGRSGVVAAGSGSLVGRACPTVYVDGVEEPRGDIDRVLPSSIHGIEVFRLGEAPAKYRSFCGVILIWTK